MPKQTPSQTVGPFFAYALTPMPYGYRGVTDANLATEVTPGEHLRLTGRVLDGEGQPVPDAVVEIWQADAEGRYRSTDFRGFGRTDTDDDGAFSFQTIKPGLPGEAAAPHINVTVFSRGMLSHAFTRIYFSDEEVANQADSVFAAVPEQRRSTLIASRRETPGGTVYDFVIRLQGEGETVFFDA